MIHCLLIFSGFRYCSRTQSRRPKGRCLLIVAYFCFVKNEILSSETRYFFLGFYSVFLFFKFICFVVQLSFAIIPLLHSLKSSKYFKIKNQESFCTHLVQYMHTFKNFSALMHVFIYHEYMSFKNVCNVYPLPCISCQIKKNERKHVKCNVKKLHCNKCNTKDYPRNLFVKTVFTNVYLFTCSIYLYVV